MLMLKNVVQNKFVIWRFFLHHCQLQLKNVKNSKLVRHTLKSRTLVKPLKFLRKWLRESVRYFLKIPNRIVSNRFDSVGHCQGRYRTNDYSKRKMPRQQSSAHKDSKHAYIEIWSEKKNRTRIFRKNHYFFSSLDHEHFWFQKRPLK